MCDIGSPEWFKKESQEDFYQKQQIKGEYLRGEFLKRFAPEKLEKMSGKVFLEQVFGNNDESMMNLLMVNKEYKILGSAGNYRFLSILYKTKDCNSWKYKKSQKSKIISDDEAIEAALDIKEKLLEAIKTINDCNLNNIDDYKELDDVFSKSNIFFYKYNWALKYFQIVFPYYFPAIYADRIKNDHSLNAVDRVLEKLGISSNHKEKLFVKIGKISLFIRECDINNIVFNEIFGANWKWNDNEKDALQNCKVQNIIINDNKTINKSLYNIPLSNDEQLKEVKNIDNYVDKLKIEGKEKEAVIKARVNQSIFRSNLINKYGSCCVCKLNNKDLLIASHIKPWSACEPKEKLDTDNGFLLCPNHDKLFDKGYISFDDDWSILISNKIDDENKTLLNISQEIKITLNEDNKKYLKYHRDIIYDKD